MVDPDAITSTPGAVALPPATTSPRPGDHVAAAPRRAAASVSHEGLPAGSMASTRAVVAPVVRVAPTTYWEPSVALTVAPPATSANEPPCGGMTSLNASEDRSYWVAPSPSISQRTVPETASDSGVRGIVGRDDSAL